MKEHDAIALILIFYYRWYLAEYDVDTFEMSKDKLEAYRQEISGEDKPRRCNWPVEFNGEQRKEIEVCINMHVRLEVCDLSNTAVIPCQPQSQSQVACITN